MEQTLVLIKPDAVERNLIGEILSHYEVEGLKIIGLKMLKASSYTVRKHYAEHLDKPFYPELEEYLTRSHLVALVIEGENAISRVRAINGATNPKEADPSTIRGKYGIDKTLNTCHASDSRESASREIDIWFR